MKYLTFAQFVTPGCIPATLGQTKASTLSFALLWATLAWADQPRVPSPDATTLIRPSRVQFFIAVDGNDGWSGTLPAPAPDRSDGPFASLGRARDAVRKWKARRPKEDIVVLLRGGRYLLQETVVFGLEDSGSTGQQITYAAYPGEEPILSGGMNIDGWQKFDPSSSRLPERSHGKVWVAKLPENVGRFYALFEGEKMLSRARGPSVLQMRPVLDCTLGKINMPKHPTVILI